MKGFQPTIPLSDPRAGIVPQYRSLWPQAFQGLEGFLYIMEGMLYPSQAPLVLSMYKSSYMADYKDFSNYTPHLENPEEVGGAMNRATSLNSLHRLKFKSKTQILSSCMTVDCSPLADYFLEQF
ncbi:protein SPMIP9 isoform X3 [Phascolarctos cinereus]|uniref:Testis-expressed sequence 37 protein isoform X3 n=1 Tax=Phascolarctos cinereus TaxID=38626 RepID=A0A6P5JKK3_PHACI|nr:testis-expressed sequence 37 protein isoform X3 [Phascolarctos cinereus]